MCKIHFSFQIFNMPHRIEISEWGETNEGDSLLAHLTVCSCRLKGRGRTHTVLSRCTLRRKNIGGGGGEGGCILLELKGQCTWEERATAASSDVCRKFPSSLQLSIDQSFLWRNCFKLGKEPWKKNRWGNSQGSHKARNKSPPQKPVCNTWGNRRAGYGLSSGDKLDLD